MWLGTVSSNFRTCTIGGWGEELQKIRGTLKGRDVRTSCLPFSKVFSFRKINRHYRKPLDRDMNLWHPSLSPSSTQYSHHRYHLGSKWTDSLPQIPVNELCYLFFGSLTEMHQHWTLMDWRFRVTADLHICSTRYTNMQAIRTSEVGDTRARSSLMSINYA